MALANFFNKSALAASHILQGYDSAEFESRLLAAPVEVAFDGEAVKSVEGLATLDLAIRILSRLYPHLILSALDEIAQQHLVTLQNTARAINPVIEFGERIPFASLVVGYTSVDRITPVYYAGSMGWLVKFSTTKPVGSGLTSNPFGAGAAACFGTANIFRTVFADQLPNGGKSDNDFILSLLDFSHTDNNTASNSLDSTIDIEAGEAILVGLGAVGQGAIWALSRLPNLRGTLHLVDGETIDLSNLQRYALAIQTDVGVAKTTVADIALSGVGDNFKQELYPMQWDAFLATRANWQLPPVLIAVDNVSDRLAIQASLPTKVFNAWTQTADLGVSRHRDFKQDACLVCLYRPRGQRPSESQVIADALGVSEHERAVREMVYNNAPLDAGWLQLIAQAKGKEVADLMPFVGKPIKAFYSQNVCGSLLLGSVTNRQTETPMAFQSALAGILLASQWLIDTNFPSEAPRETTTRIDLLRPLTPVLNEAMEKSESGRCICQDEDFLAQYESKYGIK